MTSRWVWWWRSSSREDNKTDATTNISANTSWWRHRLRLVDLKCDSVQLTAVSATSVCCIVNLWCDEPFCQLARLWTFGVFWFQSNDHKWSSRDHKRRKAAIRLSCAALSSSVWSEESWWHPGLIGLLTSINCKQYRIHMVSTTYGLRVQKKTRKTVSPHPNVKRCS